MTYAIKIEKAAVKTLAAIDKPARERIIKAIDGLKKDYDKGDALTGKFKGLWRIRCGDYRIIYGKRHEELVVLVLKIGHRKEVYR